MPSAPGMPALKQAPTETPGEISTPPAATGMPAFSTEEMLSPQWLSKNWIYLLAVAAVVLLVLAVLYYYLSPLLFPQ